MLKKIMSGCIIVVVCMGVIAGGESPAKMLNYYDGLMEYYAGYCGAIGPNEREETYMVMYPEKYALHEKDEPKKQKDIDDVSAKLKKVIPAIQKGTHEYTVLLRGEIGAYDNAKEGFACVVVSPRGFVDLAPPERDATGANGEGAGQSIISRGILFGKVSRIKLLFINADEYDMLPYPAGKAAVFLKSRTDARGNISKDISAALAIEILPRDKCRRAWDAIMQNVYTPGMEKNYFMIARIKHIDIYGDREMQDKLGTIGNTHPVLKVE